MVWYLIGVYIINRTLHDCLEIRNFSSCVEKIFHEWTQRTSEIFFNTRREISYLQATIYIYPFLFEDYQWYFSLISLYYINTNEIPNHFTLIVFGCERRDSLCSHSKGHIFTCDLTCYFYIWRYQVFLWKLT